MESAGLLCPCTSPGKNTGVGSHSLLQGVFLTQGLKLGLPHCRQILYHLGSLTLIYRNKNAGSPVWDEQQLKNIHLPKCKAFFFSIIEKSFEEVSKGRKEQEKKEI